MNLGGVEVFKSLRLVRSSCLRLVNQSAVHPFKKEAESIYVRAVLSKVRA